MRLAELILAWAQALRHAIVSVGAQGQREFDTREAFLVAATPADAWHLSGELANLIDELIIEDVAWDKLDPLVLPEFDRLLADHTRFSQYRDQGMAADAGRTQTVDKAWRQNALIEAHMPPSCRMAPRPGPVIAIGSTGSHRATARLLAAIARAPRGAVVLPGLDQDLDASAWALIAGGSESDGEASFTHPQAALCRLLRILQVRREDVVSLGEARAPSRPARQILSRRLCVRRSRPANGWPFGKRVGANELAAALQGVSLIEARDEREEALALAIAMREVIWRRRAKPRRLSRRIANSPAAFARNCCAGISWPMIPPGNLSARNRSGFSRGSRSPAPRARWRRRISPRSLRTRCCGSVSPAPILNGAPRSSRSACCARIMPRHLAACLAGEPAALIARAREDARSPFAHPAKQRISEKEWDDLHDLLVRLGAQFAPLLNLRGEVTLDRWVAAHRETIEAIASSEDDDEDREALDDALR